MRRLPNLEKIVLHYTGQKYRVYSVKWIWNGYGAMTYNNEKIIKISEDQLKSPEILWHEMGHVVKDRDFQKLWQAEYEAQKWALLELKNLKKLKLYRKSLKYVKEWIKEPTEENQTPSDEAYYRAAIKLLKEFK